VLTVDSHPVTHHVDLFLLSPCLPTTYKHRDISWSSFQETVGKKKKSFKIILNHQPVINQLSTSYQPVINQLSTSYQPVINQLCNSSTPSSSNSTGNKNPPIRPPKRRLASPPQCHAPQLDANLNLEDLDDIKSSRS